ncbi:hypothetical protein HZS_3583, partial [Henneguya salminicola]
MSTRMELSYKLTMIRFFQDTFKFGRGIPFIFGGTVALVSIWYYYWYYRAYDSDSLEEKDTQEIKSKIFKTSLIKISYAILPRNDIINRIQKTSDTIIKIPKSSKKLLDDPINYDKLGQILITGSKNNIDSAEIALFSKFQEIIVYATTLHHSYLKHIIGKKGKRLDIIRRSTGAMIRITKKSSSKYIQEDHPEKGIDHILYIVGTHYEVTESRNEIDHIIYNTRLDNITIPRPPKLNISQNKSPPESRTQGICDVEKFDLVERWEVLTNKYKIRDLSKFVQNDGFVYIWITSFVSPNLFWVQLDDILDSVCCELNDSNDTIDKSTTITVISSRNNCKPDQMVAAPFKKTGRYLRAVVLQCLSKYQSILLFVDYGNTLIIENSLIKELSDKHKQLPWQAIPCNLADIYSFDVIWSDQALSTFSKLTSVGQALPSKLKIKKMMKGNILHVDLITCDGS